MLLENHNFSDTSHIYFTLICASSLGTKGKRKRLRTGGGTKGGNGATLVSGEDSGLQSPPDSASKTPWTPRYLSDLKSSNIYNRNAIEAPAEVVSYTNIFLKFHTLDLIVIV